MENDSEIFTGWKLHYMEVSNGVYEIELTDRFGRKAGCTYSDLDKGIDTCISYVFDIEKQINKNWGKFLFDLFEFNLSKHNSIYQTSQENNFNCWTIQLKKGRIVLNSQGSTIVFQNQDENQHWIDKENCNLNNLTYSKVVIMTSL